MSLKSLLQQLSKEGFSIVRSGDGYKVMRNQLLGSFSAVTWTSRESLYGQCSYSQRV